jgi:hypothetical protein
LQVIGESQEGERFVTPRVEAKPAASVAEEPVALSAAKYKRAARKATKKASANSSK